MGVPLPGDPIFKQSNNGYNVTAYKSICAEFGIDPNSDFQFTAGNNKGLRAKLKPKDWRFESCGSS